MDVGDHQATENIELNAANQALANMTNFWFAILERFHADWNPSVRIDDAE
jgi:hypothetical protein